MNRRRVLIFKTVVCAVRAVVGGSELVHKVSGIRATLGVRSGAASLEKFSYDSAPPAASRLRLHLTIDQSFKDRLAQAKKTTSAGQWSPISPTPTVIATLAPDRLWDSFCPDNVIADLAGAPGHGGLCFAGGDRGCAQPVTTETTWCGDACSVVDGVATTTTTPADLSDLCAVDLLPFPADWNVELSDVDVDADFSPLTDVRPPPTDLAWFFPATATSDQSAYLGAQLPDFSELFPVYDDVVGACAVGDEAPMFSGVDDIWWNTFSVGHAISDQ